MSAPFRAFAEAADAVREARGTLRKARIVADLLAALPPGDASAAAVFLTGAPFPRVDPRVPRAGWSVLRQAALNVTPWDRVVWGACVTAVGDLGETVAKLFEVEPPRRRTAQATLLDYDASAPAPRAGGPTLAEVRGAFDSLVDARTALERRRIVEDAWLAMTPVEAKYFTKILTGGMRLGLAEGLVEDAIARAFGRDLEAVRAANMLTGDIGEVVRLAREDRLAEAKFRLFHPLQFMLATPLDEIPDALEGYVAEDKFDGVRAQLHVADGRAVLYSRTLDEAPEFPEIVEAARRLKGALVLDGEIVAWRRDRVAPFALLQRRLGRKDVGEDVRREVPVRFLAYDVLYAGEPVHERPFTERRALLEALRLPEPLAVAPVFPVATRDDVERLFAEARSRGNEGVMLKRASSPYELGKRGRQWLKVKRPFATLDVVVTAVEEGHGKRAGLLSDYTFAVRGPEGDWLNVGKAYTGLTDAEIESMTRLFQGITREKYGGTRVVEPRVVIEVAFDTVQRSARHKSGFALRFPRIVRLRPDKRPEDADTIARVEDLHRLALGDVNPAEG